MKIEYILFAIWVISTFISLFDLFKNNKESFDDPIAGVNQGSLILVCIFPVLNTIMCIFIIFYWIKNYISPITRNQMIEDEVNNMILRQKIYNPSDTYESKVDRATWIVDNRLAEKKEIANRKTKYSK